MNDIRRRPLGNGGMPLLVGGGLAVVLAGGLALGGYAALGPGSPAANAAATKTVEGHGPTGGDGGATQSPSSEPSSDPDRDRGRDEEGTSPGEAPAPPEDTVYVIEAGDTLTSLSAKFGMSVDALARYNAISNTNVISEGATLRVPGEYPPESWGL